MKMLLMAVLLLFLPSCVHRPDSFDEGRWRKEVEATKPTALYEEHVKDGVYFNPWLPRDHAGFMRLVKWKFSSKPSYTAEEKAFGPQFIPNLKERIKAMPEGDFIAWIGHATFLIRLRGQYFLTDPMLSERALLPKRVTPPALTEGDIKEIAPEVNVIISHNHYDHLDRNTVELLPPGGRVFVPAGLKRLAEKMRGVRGDPGGPARPVSEMDWWQSVDVGHDIRVICLPAQHWSRRLLGGINSSLWVSYMIVTPETTIYFGGDSGYFIGYREFGRLYPRIDYALIGTTAVHPRWFMHYSHMSIDEVLDAFDDLGAHRFIPTQWGTFPLGDEPPGQPVLELKRTIESRGLDPSRFIIMDIGQIVSVERRQKD
jgi:N-acyl-phosphatidylethanolamine-hydrolysing phospholipase D